MKKEKIDKILAKAYSAIEAGKFSQAITALKKINDTYSLRTFESLSLEAKALSKSNKTERELDAYYKLLQLKLTNEQQIKALNNIGRIEKKLSRVEKAIASLEKSINLDDSIHNAGAQMRLCELYREKTYFSESELLANKLKRWSEYYAHAQYQLMLIAKSKLDKKEVISRVNDLANHFRQIKEEYIDRAVESLQAVGAENEAYLLLKKAEAYLGTKPWIIYYLANYYYQQKEYETVVELITDELIKSFPVGSSKKSMSYKLRADAYDKLKSFDGAFQDYSALSSIYEEKYKRIKNVDIAESYRKLDLKTLPESDKVLERYCPVFMMGFPRSGTTLLDTILDTQDNVVTLSETATLASVRIAFEEKLNKTYPNDIQKLSRSEINILRGVYYDVVDSLQLNINNETLIIDKMPLNTIHLPLILTLFPDSKIIFSLRHPLDVCLSNFQQDYIINEEMFFLISLEGCVKRYKKIFRLFDSYQKYLNPSILFVRYEDLITDLPLETNKIFNYLNIKDNGKGIEFYKHAQNKIINTPSQKQVTQKLYSSATYKWKNYSKHMEKYIPVLQEYISKFGYDAEPL